MPLNSLNDGFYCPKIDSHLYYSQTVVNPWVQIDLRNYYSIKCVRIITRDKSINKNNNYFENVEIRFGNFSGKTSITSNTLVGSVKSIYFNTIIEICPQINIFAKFLFFQKISSNKTIMIIPEVQILVK